MSDVQSLHLLLPEHHQSTCPAEVYLQLYFLGKCAFTLHCMHLMSRPFGIQKLKKYIYIYIITIFLPLERATIEASVVVYVKSIMNCFLFIQ